MAYADYLWRMLEPLGVYRRDGYSGGAIQALGESLDAVEEELARKLRESQVESAEQEGLQEAEALFPLLAADTTDQRRIALERLYQTDYGSFTKEKIIETLAGCGIPVTILELDTPMQVLVAFEKQLVIEEDPVFQMWVLEQIMPCHLIVVCSISYEDVDSGEIAQERLALSTLRKRTQSEWEARLGAYI